MKTLLVIKEGVHADTEMYIKAIKRGANKRNVKVVELDILNCSGVDLTEEIHSCDGIIAAEPISNVEGYKISSFMTNHLYKDLDDFTACSPYFNCTLNGVINALEERKVNLTGLDVCVIGRNLGLSIADYMRDEDATVQICHSKTKNLKEKTIMADIVVCCASSGKKILNPNMVKPTALVIDVGMNVEGDFKNIIDFKEIGRRNINNIFKKMGCDNE
ncbi:hypothetical protein FDF74_11595 [Clostridium niameyense]|uniref:methenyltetrahydrofolate cyclohydrolase n=1 Tax=Clostridium niameyense TaxID=1622073 RepID=A0A6M0RC02_9CLOT|nr:hypothetical protein [Clostridium niameyense]NEZ47825.1 hypothetical protein [Clostridium niameyense]